MISFQLVGLPLEPFASLFDLPDSELTARNVQRVIAATNPGYPCRVSLIDAEVGEELLLLPFEHQPASSPYKASGPIFVRTRASQTCLDPGVIPDYVRRRLISVRAYDNAGQMTDAAVCDGNEAASAIQQMFLDNRVGYIHLHNAKRGCFSCLVNRISAPPP